MQVPDLATAIALANRIAPEHLELMTDRPMDLVGDIRRAHIVTPKRQAETLEVEYACRQRRCGGCCGQPGQRRFVVGRYRVGLVVQDLGPDDVVAAAGEDEAVDGAAPELLFAGVVGEEHRDGVLAAPREGWRFMRAPRVLSASSIRS